MDEQLLQAATENFTLPHDIVKLPTNGVFYKNKKNAVKVGYLTAQDENFLMSDSSRDNLVITLLRNKLYEHDLRPDELIESDIEAILIFLRNTSFGTEYNIKLIDPKTSKVFEHVEHLDVLKIQDTKIKPDDNGMFVTTLPRTNSTVKLKPISFSESLELNKLSDSYPKGRVAPIVTSRLLKEIISVDDNEDKAYIAKFIEQLPISDSKHIRKFLNENVPKLDLKRETIAPSGELVTFNVSFGAEFFRPFF